MIELMNEPQRIATSVAGSPPTASLSTNLRLVKSTPPSSHADRRHDDVVDERVDDRPERAADDDADGQRQGIGLEQELP